MVAEQPDTPFSLRGGAGCFVSAIGRIACRAAISPADFPAHIGRHSCEGKTVEEGLRIGALWNAAFLQSHDLGEAVAAFMERRPARFQGR
jgi:hypothetical protein